MDDHDQPASDRHEARPSGSAVLTVELGAIAVAEDRGAVLRTGTVGSGIAVTMYDPDVAVGGILHCLLPDASVDPTRRVAQPALFADSGLELLLHQMKTRGAAPERLQCHVAGGADPIQLGIAPSALSLGPRIAAAVLGLLETWNLGVVAVRTGGSRARRVRLEVGTGAVHVTETPAERRAVEPRG